MSNSMGLISEYSGQNSNDNLWEFLHASLSKNRKVKLLRFAFPSIVREQFISEIDPDTKPSKKPDFLKLITDNDLVDFEILTVNPFSNSYLGKMDSENSDNLKIIRVKNQIIQFINGILHFNKKHSKNILIGCYQTAPIWNLAISKSLENYEVMIKSYGLKSEEIGHNTKTQEIVLKSGTNSLFAESFVNYYSSILNDKSTIFFYDKEEIDDFKKVNDWPSLFKSNIIENNNNQYIQKYFNDYNSFNIELECYRINKQDKDICNYFKIPSLHSQISKKNKWAGEGICIENIPCRMWSDILSEIHKTIPYNDEDKNSKFSKILGQILMQSLESLSEFRNLANIMGIDKNITKYPYLEKIKHGILEIKPFIRNINTSIYKELDVDIAKLCKFLEMHADTIFRDAHLKNRIFKTYKIDIPKILEDFQRINEKDIPKLINENTFDIDFETCKNKVTKWDDVCHILLFDDSGLLDIDLNKCDNDLIQEGNKIINIINEVFSLNIKPDEINIFWQTLLFRATREHFRRIWYANVMPNTYKMRYHYEKTSYYIELAIFARIQSKSFPYIQKFLENIQSQNNYLFRLVDFNSTTIMLYPYLTALNTTANIDDNKKLENMIEKIYQIITEPKIDEKEISIKKELGDIFKLEPNWHGIGIDLKKLFKLIKRIPDSFNSKNVRKI